MGVVDTLPAVVLETERLTLCRFTAADAPFVRTLLNDAAFLELIGDRCHEAMNCGPAPPALRATSP